MTDNTDGSVQSLARFETVRLERRGRTAWITLERPEALNCIGPSCVRDLGEALDLVENDPALLAVVVTGSGRAFCAGADLSAVRRFGQSADPVAASAGFREAANALLARIESLPRPVVAAVNGIALAGGLELVLVCDLVVSAEDAVFGDAHAKYGLIPGWGGSARLPRKIGINRAKEMMFTAGHFPAATMRDWGLVNQVVGHADLEAAAQALCDRITDKSPLGMRRMKVLVNAACEQSLDDARRDELVQVQEHQLSRDMAEGVAAFAEKRRPVYAGD